MNAPAPTQPRITGATRLVGIVGDPVRQVKSPESFNARFFEQELDVVMVPLHVPTADFDAVIGALMRTANLDGLVITMPFKDRIIAHLGEVSDAARHVGAVNAVRRTSAGGWFGDIFDGVGLVGAVRTLGLSPEGLRVGLIGAGGAGSAIAFALAERHIASLSILDADKAKADGLARRIMQAHGVPVLAGSFGLGEIDLLVNASPVGMQTGDGTPIDVASLGPEVSVIDIVTRPTTPLLEAAKAAGCRHAGGAAMVAAQTVAIIDFLDLGRREA